MTADDAGRRRRAHAWVRAFAGLVTENATSSPTGRGHRRRRPRQQHGPRPDRRRGARSTRRRRRPGGLFKLVGMTLISTVGGASGPLYGTLFLRPAGRSDVDDAAGVRRGAAGRGRGRRARGEAELGRQDDAGRAAPRRSTRSTARSPTAPARRRARGGGGRGRSRARRDRPAGRPQGTGELSRRAQRRPPGPGRHLGGDAARGGRRPRLAGG